MELNREGCHSGSHAPEPEPAPSRADGSKLPGVVNLNLNDADVDTSLVAEAIKQGEKGTLLDVDCGDGDHVTISLK